MPMTAMIRNLVKMTSIGLLAEGSQETMDVCEKLKNVQLLRNAKIHPFNVLVALKKYEGLGWTANQEILGALQKAFYYSFQV
jgi:60 kDa SS-A/Ro ribonucleoprotein